METTDLHMHVYPYDYYSDRPVDTVGLARTATIIEAFRAEAANSILVDNGDFLQGNPMGDYIAYERGMREGDVHPVIAAMNAVGFDAATLGNHEFDYGLDFLGKSLSGAAFPIVCANVTRKSATKPTRDQTYVAPYAILNRTVAMGDGTEHSIRIGLIGFVPPQVMTWNRRHLEGKLEARDIVEAAEAWVPQMLEEGCDLIVALSHSGIAEATRTEMMENASVPLAEVTGIDALMTGHSHLVFPSPTFADHPAVDAEAGTIHGKPAVMGGFWGSHMGLVDLLLERDGGTWRVVTAQSEARPISKRDRNRSVIPLVGDHGDVLDAVRQQHEETLVYVRRAVGKTATPLHSYFALVTGDPSVQLVLDAQRWYVAQMLAGTEYEGLPLLSAAAPFKAGGRAGPEHYTDVPSGDLAIKHVADLYLYPNMIRAVKVTGAQLRDWLERSAGLFNRITPGSHDAPMHDPAFASYNFDVIDGVRYRIDLSRPSRFGVQGEVLNPASRRIVDLEYLGRPVTDAMHFIVATNSFRAAGGGAFHGAFDGTIVLDAPDTNRDAIVRYIAEKGAIALAPKDTWGFRPMPGTTVTFRTGPRAAKHARDIADVAIEEIGLDEDGFALYRMTL